MNIGDLVNFEHSIGIIIKIQPSLWEGSGNIFTIYVYSTGYVHFRSRYDLNLIN